MGDGFVKSLIELPDPDYIWSGPEILAVAYLDHSLFTELMNYDDFHYLTGGKFIFDKRNEIFLRLAGKIELFEGECFVYLVHGTGFDNSLNKYYKVVEDMGIVISKGKVP